MMDSKEVAEQLGTTGKKLRKFLRSPMSTFTAVGSGGRYSFTEEDLPTLRTKFEQWEKGGTSPRKKPTPSDSGMVRNTTPRRSQLDRDREVWAEEGTVTLPDIRNPRIRARVLADARAAEDRIEAALLAAGLHVTQMKG